MTLPCIRPVNGGVFIEVYVSPHSDREEIAYDQKSCIIRIRVKEPPEKGRANKAALRLLKKKFGACELVSGSVSRQKTVFLRGLTVAEVEELIKKPCI